ncbi:MAG: twin-arginine translocase TatA/TatE family subunit [Euryarchaeota archaeon]|nr:twin-arginine translocase TatA/TatE family subunit [Euryarchaeota archaeon]MBU4492562.1 twin-arginine translocase TatA/TatE family subunit [Euryarchaeota archaeon]MCG2728065.1 twin-arginine translocase TatA/TatE family subunit [Candidatus Methanoperedenaceae archaeon]
MAIGTQEIILIALVVIILFGASKIPELARSLGKATGEFKKGQKEIERELTDVEKLIKESKSPEEKSSKLKQMAKDLGIATEGKSDDQLLDEIQKKMPTVKYEK